MSISVTRNLFLPYFLFPISFPLDIFLCLCIFLHTQVDRSCHRILQDLPGKMRESHRILQENTGNTWNMEAAFPPGIFRIFSDDFRTDPARKHWKLSESTGKNPEIPDRNTASNFLVFSVTFRPFPSVRRSPGYISLLLSISPSLSSFSSL